MPTGIVNNNQNEVPIVVGEDNNQDIEINNSYQNEELKLGGSEGSSESIVNMQSPNREVYNKNE